MLAKQQWHLELMRIKQQPINRFDWFQPRRATLVVSQNDQQIQDALALGLSNHNTYEFPLGAVKTSREPAARLAFGRNW